MRFCCRLFFLSSCEGNFWKKWKQVPLLFKMKPSQKQQCEWAEMQTELHVCSYLSVLLPQVPQMSWSGEGFHLHVSCSIKIRDKTEQVPPLPTGWQRSARHLRRSCSAGSPSWCERLTRTGSSSGSPARPSSSSARSSAWPGLCRLLLPPICLAGIRAASPHPFSAWTCTGMNREIKTIRPAALGSTRGDGPYFLRRGQSFMKWPILPQIRQQRSFGATSPSVRTSGSKKYSWTGWRRIPVLF